AALRAGNHRVAGRTRLRRRGAGLHGDPAARPRGGVAAARDRFDADARARRAARGAAGRLGPDLSGARDEAATRSVYWRTLRFGSGTTEASRTVPLYSSLLAAASARCSVR